jgi:glyoxylase-like metal-dependent hydrolase (beta-lactamase superfamily II)
MDAQQVAPGVHRIHSHDVVNWYLVEDEGRLAMVDAGLPPDWDTLERTARALSRTLSDLDLLFTGDALVTRNPYTGDTGPRLVSLAATADAEQALQSLDRIAETGAGTLLAGHGEPWKDGAQEAAARARAAGWS